MTVVRKNTALSDLAERFDILINNYRSLLSKVRPKAAVEKTKLWSYKRSFQSLGDMKGPELTSFLGLISKYCAINYIFDNPSRIMIPDEKLLELLEGRHIIDDAGEGYNGTFFELSMAIRLAQRLGAAAVIDLTTDCDVIWGQEFAFECKYLQSSKKFRSNISDAMSQLDSRIDGGLAKIGIVALDLTNLLDREKIQSFAQGVFDSFATSYVELSSSRGYLASGLQEDGVVTSVLNDKNFANIVSGFIAFQAEQTFHLNFTFSELDKLDERKVAIFYQYSNFIYVDYNGEVVPLPFRGLNYFISHGLPSIYYSAIERLAHSLAVGI
jgi:hypothetical protein